MTQMPQNQMPAPSLIGRLSMALFRPVQFFRILPSMGATRHWVWAAFLILGLVGFAAVQQGAAPTGGNLGGGEIPFADPMSDMPFPMDGMPIGGGGGGTGGAAGNNDSWLTALTAAGVIVLHWGALTLLLAEVTLFNGYRPQFSRNLHIAIWSTLPLALMAGLQLLFQSGGGQLGAVGFSGFLAEWPTYIEADILGKSLLYGVAANLTLFWLWCLALLYLGGRHTLKGKRFAVWVVVIAWVVIQVLFTGYEHYQELERQSQNEMIPDMGFDGMGFDDFSDGMGFDAFGMDEMNFEDSPDDFVPNEDPLTDDFSAEGEAEDASLPDPDADNAFSEEAFEDATNADE